MSFQVEITETANQDLDEILRWLSERAPAAAVKLSSQFDKALSRLEFFPLSCGLAYENSLVKEELRHLLFGIRKGRSYRALFVVRGQVVTILRIRAPGQQPASREDLGI
jgi:plasmid stabilization system protein ParE